MAVASTTGPADRSPLRPIRPSRDARRPPAGRDPRPGVVGPRARAVDPRRRAGGGRAPFEILAPAEKADGRDRFALVIGNAAYRNVPSLRNPINDANAIGERLHRLGFEVTRARDLDRRATNETVDIFLARLTPGADVVVYFAGHGVEVQGANHLLPVDVPKLQVGQDRVLRSETTNLTDLMSDLRDKAPRALVMILDACRDNPFAGEGTRSIGSLPRARPGRAAQGLARDLLGRRRRARPRQPRRGRSEPQRPLHPHAPAADGRGGAGGPRPRAPHAQRGPRGRASRRRALADAGLLRRAARQLLLPPEARDRPERRGLRAQRRSGGRFRSP